jgi:hypothetical protein
MVTDQQIAEILRRNPTIAMLANRAKEVGKQYPLNPTQSTSPSRTSAQTQTGPGGARFGMGAGGPNRFDFTQLYSGLWSIGIDPNSPTLKQDVQRWYDSQPANVRAEVQRGMGNQPGRGSIDPLVYATDWRARDVARKIQKSNSFMDSTFGKILGTALPLGLGMVAAPLGIGASAAIGGATGGLKGAVLGGIGSAIAPGVGIPTGALSAPIKAATSMASRFANPATISRQLASMGIGRLNRNG